MYYITGGIAIILFGVLCYVIGHRVGYNKAMDEIAKVIEERLKKR